MTPEQTILATIMYLERLEVEPSVRRVTAVLKATTGQAFRTALISATIQAYFIRKKSSGQHLGNTPETDSVLAGNTQEDTPALRTTKELFKSLECFADAKHVLPDGNTNTPPNTREESETLVPLPVQTPVPQERRRVPRQAALGLEQAETIAAADLCRALWLLLAPSMVGQTQTGWKVKQVRTARDMVRAGVTLEQLSAAAEEFYAVRGYYPKRLEWLQEFMSRSERRPVDDEQNWVDNLPLACEVMAAQHA